MKRKHDQITKGISWADNDVTQYAVYNPGQKLETVEQEEFQQYKSGETITQTKDRLKTEKLIKADGIFTFDELMASIDQMNAPKGTSLSQQFEQDDEDDFAFYAQMREAQKNSGQQSVAAPTILTNTTLQQTKNPPLKSTHPQ